MIHDRTDRALAGGEAVLIDIVEFNFADGQWSEAFLMAKDIRDKYVLGRLLWDLGLLKVA